MKKLVFNITVLITKIVYTIGLENIVAYIAALSLLQ